MSDFRERMAAARRNASLPPQSNQEESVASADHGLREYVLGHFPVIECLEGVKTDVWRGEGTISEEAIDTAQGSQASQAIRERLQRHDPRWRFSLISDPIQVHYPEVDSKSTDVRSSKQGYGGGNTDSWEHKTITQYRPTGRFLSKTFQMEIAVTAGFTGGMRSIQIRQVDDRDSLKGRDLQAWGVTNLDWDYHMPFHAAQGPSSIEVATLAISHQDINADVDQFVDAMVNVGLRMEQEGNIPFMIRDIQR